VLSGILLPGPSGDDAADLKPTGPRVGVHSGVSWASQRV
jgi:hypothetical protein